VRSAPKSELGKGSLVLLTSEVDYDTVAVDLIVGGVWKGPALLLAPAHALLGRYMRVNAPVLPTGTKVTIVHGTNDKVVPLDDSRALQGRLIECDDDHHLRKFLTKATLTRLIEDLAKDT
jgi:fermentation-respiration switch protein FrsA (DUF1100 family)